MEHTVRTARATGAPGRFSADDLAERPIYAAGREGHAPSQATALPGRAALPEGVRSRFEKESFMAEPAQNVFHALDQALAAAVAAAARSVVHVARGHGIGGTGIAWASDLVISASFHTPDRTTIGIASDDGEIDRRSRIAGDGDPDGSAGGAGVLPLGIDRRDAEVIGRDPGTDVPLLRVAGGGLAPASFRDLG